jgi:NAD(P)H-flavin reductase
MHSSAFDRANCTRLPFRTKSSLAANLSTRCTRRGARILSLSRLTAASGIGLAPLRGALHQLVRCRKKLGKLVLLYGVRAPEDILYGRELELWKSRGLQVSVTVDRAPSSWLGHVGVVTTLIPRATFDPGNTVAMVCGPEVMMRYTVFELQKRGVPAENIFLSMERNMKCAIGFCGHCQFGPEFICKDGPIFSYNRIANWLGIREL